MKFWITADFIFKYFIKQNFVLKKRNNIAYKLKGGCPCQMELYNTLTSSLSKGNTTPNEYPVITLNNLKVRFEP